MIEELTNQELRKPKDCAIQIKTGTSNGSLKLAIHNLQIIGNVEKLVHYRYQSKSEYVTIITGERYEMAIIGDLTSGYGGSGPNALVELLKYLGFEEKYVEPICFDSTYKNAVITFRK